MRPVELLEMVRKAITDRDLAHRLHDLMAVVDASKFLAQDARFVQYAHDKYLPAAKEYRDYLHHGGSHTARSHRFKTLQGRLGGTSREMYKRQEATFRELVNVLTHSPLRPFLSPEVMDELWKHFKHVERKWLSDARRH